MPQHAMDNEVGPLASCFGMSALDALPGAVLVRLLGVYGRSPQAARSVIARQRRRGVLVARSTGRISWYRLAGPVLEEFTAVRRRSFEPRQVVEGWDGIFHGLLVSAPETERAWRDQVRRVAVAHGYRMLRPGVLVQVVDLGGVVRRLVPPPEGCSLVPVDLRLSPEDARAEARQMWELDATAGRLEAAVGALRAMGTPPVPFGEADLQRYVRTVGPVYPLLMSAPALPTSLVGDGWPAGRLVAALEGVNAAWLGPVDALVRRWVDEVGAVSPWPDAS